MDVKESRTQMCPVRCTCARHDLSPAGATSVRTNGDTSQPVTQNNSKESSPCGLTGLNVSSR